jgi:integrase
VTDPFTDLLASLSGECKMEPANLSTALDGERMARTQYQTGSLRLRGKRAPTWYAVFRESIIVDGKIVRRQRWEILGTKKDYPTQKLALRALEGRVAPLNSLAYRPRPVAKFSEFAKKWERTVLPNLKPGTQPPIRSQLRRHLVPVFGDVAMKDISPELVQSFVTDCKLSPKTAKNLVTTLRIMWNSALDWGYVGNNPMERIRLPEWKATEQPVFSREEVQRIMAEVDPHYWPALWLVIQTGIRRGELCGLNVGDVDFAGRCVEIRRSRSGKYLTNTKSKKPRGFPISPRLAARLARLAGERGADEPMFLSKEGRRLHPDNFASRVIAPVVKKLGLKGGLHAFRHGNATAQDQLGVPMATRQSILGHVNTRTTMNYTHLLTEDVRRVPEMLDDYFCIADSANEPHVLLATVSKSEEKALAPESQRLRIQ